MKRKILLISPPSIGRLFPRGLVEIASFLEAKGCSTQILPLAYYTGCFDDVPAKQSARSLERKTSAVLEDVIGRSSPEVIGVSNQFTKHYPECLKILGFCKRINKKITTVIGGPHVTFLDEDCARSPFVDIVVRGEGEWTMLDLILALGGKKDLNNVKGITFKEKGRIVRTPERILGDLKELPPMDFELLPHDFVKRSRVCGLLNRGCLYHCQFCAERIFWRKRRSFPVQRIIDEMKVLESKYKNKMTGIEDSMLYLGSPQCFELCQRLLKERISLPSSFYVQSRVDTLTDEGIEALKSVGINNVWLGIESASPKVLKAMGKDIDIDKTIKACRKLREHGMTTSGFWIIGHPGDDPKEAAYSLKMFSCLLRERLLKGADIALFLPYPGTCYFNEPGKYGIEIMSLNWRRWGRQSGAPVCRLKDFSEKDIQLFYRKSQAILLANRIRERDSKIEYCLRNRHRKIIYGE